MSQHRKRKKAPPPLWTYYWPDCPKGYSWGGPPVRAHHKSEARALVKERLGVSDSGRLPVGVVFKRLVEFEKANA